MWPSQSMKRKPCQDSVVSESNAQVSCSKLSRLLLGASARCEGSCRTWASKSHPASLSGCTLHSPLKSGFVVSTPNHTSREFADKARHELAKRDANAPNLSACSSMREYEAHTELQTLGTKVAASRWGLAMILDSASSIKNLQHWLKASEGVRTNRKRLAEHCSACNHPARRARNC